MKKYIASYGSAFLISLLGLLVGLFYQSRVVITILAAASALPILFLVLNIIFAKQYSKKIKSAKIADMQGYMLQHRAEAEKSVPALLSKLENIRRTTVIYTVLLWLLGACAAFLGGMIYLLTANVSIYVGVLYSGSIFFLIYSRIYKEEIVELNDTSNVLSKEEYPNIYGIAERAADKLECRGEITIILAYDCNASILASGNKYYLQLGAVLLNILSEEELYCICLHEFSHYSEKNNKMNFENKYHSWITSDRGIPRMLSFLTSLFVFFDFRYFFSYFVYSYAASVRNEIFADYDMAKHGTPEIAASALLKINFDDKFRWEDCDKDAPSIYEGEKPNPNYVSEYIARLKNDVAIHHEAWTEMLMREIIPNNASHPILRMRLETLGVDKISYVEYESSAEYKREIEALLKLADKRLCEMQDTYEEERKKHYLEPLERITEWKNAGMPISAESYCDIVTDLKSIGLNREAEELCERVMTELDENSSYHAYFIKGCSLLYRYDESGIELIYHALDGNQNYIEDGMQMIGAFCCTMGMEKELLEYRERAKVLAQKDVDVYSETGFLSKRDNLIHDDMPKEMLDEILAYIRSVDGGIIRRVYLVRKVINESFFTSVFVVMFDGGDTKARGEVIHKIFRYLDTYPVEWNFSLFDYNDYYKIKFDKIEGSLVFDKLQNRE